MNNLREMEKLCIHILLEDHGGAHGPRSWARDGRCGVAGSELEAEPPDISRSLPANTTKTADVRASESCNDCLLQNSRVPFLNEGYVKAIEFEESLSTFYGW